MIDDKEIIGNEDTKAITEANIRKLRALEIQRFLGKLSMKKLNKMAKEIIGNEDPKAITEANIRKLKKRLHILQVQKFYQDIEETQKRKLESSKMG